MNLMDDYVPCSAEDVQRGRMQEGESRLFDFGSDAFARCRIEFEPEDASCVSSAPVAIALGEVVCGHGNSKRLERNPGAFRSFLSAEFQAASAPCVFDFPIPPHRSPYAQEGKCPTPESCGGELLPFRYVEISGFRGTVTVRRTSFHAPFDDSASSFHTEDPNLNRLWDFCKYTVKMTSVFGMYIDGERERLPYEGDAYINQLSHFCVDSDASCAARSIEHLLAHPTWPLEWRLLMPLMVRDYLLYSGNADHARQCFPALRDSLQLHALGADGLLPAVLPGRSNGEAIRVICDWPPSERDQYEFGTYPLIGNAFLYAALCAMTDLGRMLSQFSAAEEYRRLAEKLRCRIRASMMRRSTDDVRQVPLFRDHPDSAHCALHTASAVLRFGIADAPEYPELLALMRSRGMACSVFASQFLLDAFCIARDSASALALMRSDGLRSWNNMIAKGAGMTMEAWDDSVKPNQDWNHAWATAPANVLMRRIAGIRPLESGFSLFEVDPQADGLPGGMLECKQPTPFGPIKLSRLSRAENAGWRLEIPRGTEALFRTERYPSGTHRIEIR